MDAELQSILEDFHGFYENLKTHEDARTFLKKRNEHIPENPVHGTTPLIKAKCVLSQNMDERIAEYCEKNDLDWYIETRKVQEYLCEKYQDDFWILIVQ